MSLDDTLKVRFYVVTVEPSADQYGQELAPKITQKRVSGGQFDKAVMDSPIGSTVTMVEPEEGTVHSYLVVVVSPWRDGYRRTWRS